MEIGFSCGCVLLMCKTFSKNKKWHVWLTAMFESGGTNMFPLKFLFVAKSCKRLRKQNGCLHIFYVIYVL